MIETYGSKISARDVARKMRGWEPTRIEKLYMPDSPDADTDGNVYIITGQDVMCRRTLHTDRHMR